MRPVLFEIFNREIYGYGTMIAIGILSAILLLNYRIKDKKYNEDHIFNMIIIGIVSGVFGGKLLYIITDFKYIIDNPSSLKDLGYGFVIYGAIIGGALGVYLYCRKRGWNALEMFDLIVPSLALAQGFGRIGCFFAGCCYGRATTLPIGVDFTNSPFVTPGVLRHPTQIYSAIFDFSLAAFLIWYSKRNKNAGRIFALYAIIYGIGRIAIEFLRDDPRGTVGMMSTSQFISIFAIIIGIVIFNLNRFKSKLT
ncbi:prolipoprotein diacylglyceryl transferase [Clostridium sp. MSJ-11]|uniref:Phosphatidylglycerol--prolipoprotein diacylglyceryl transferase n=1 Tax=Clostridium mobile TaxID=2841512 RepID=A0ABS6EP86_9CLOT|nr:prolipoprotein diacylglyceryl transferase [Clostridium mobile]MBU5486204.1 prolipoprotein diacylglyceryl transferase [Clostridium mobile]